MPRRKKRSKVNKVTPQTRSIKAKGHAKACLTGNVVVVQKPRRTHQQKAASDAELSVNKLLSNVPILGKFKTMMD